ncbi:hypothetical protein [Streptomyces sp. NPDC050704]|uniref:hypothetical protein n=1 Tax=Streptomyces sp. NPDC050704 TaxID=3157219 RepID=UPI0034134CB5
MGTSWSPPAGTRDPARGIAPAVAKAALEDGAALEVTEAELCAAVSATYWTPQYAS